MSKIKICGVKTIQDIEIVNILKPDFIGFVFVPTSSRYVNFTSAKNMRKKLNNNIKAVGVFQNCEINLIKQAIKKINLDAVQLHGDENQIYINELQKLKISIIKAYSIENELPKIFESDFIMFDSKKGGSGTTFDWQILCNTDLSKTFLAGGINIGNIKKASNLKPYCIDISSGSESCGKKDYQKISELIKAVRYG